MLMNMSRAVLPAAYSGVGYAPIFNENWYCPVRSTNTVVMKLNTFMLQPQMMLQTYPSLPAKKRQMDFRWKVYWIAETLDCIAVDHGLYIHCSLYSTHEDNDVKPTRNKNKRIKREREVMICVSLWWSLLMIYVLPIYITPLLYGSFSWPPPVSSHHNLHALSSKWNAQHLKPTKTPKKII